MELWTFTFIFWVLRIINEICKKYQKDHFMYYVSYKFLGNRIHSYFDKWLSLAFHLPLTIYFLACVTFINEAPTNILHHHHWYTKSINEEHANTYVDILWYQWYHIWTVWVRSLSYKITKHIPFSSVLLPLVTSFIKTVMKHRTVSLCIQ